MSKRTIFWIAFAIGFTLVLVLSTCKQNETIKVNGGHIECKDGSCTWIKDK
jgi:hypothetical protein